MCTPVIQTMFTPVIQTMYTPVNIRNMYISPWSLYKRECATEMYYAQEQLGETVDGANAMANNGEQIIGCTVLYSTIVSCNYDTMGLRKSTQIQTMYIQYNTKFIVIMGGLLPQYHNKQ